MLMITMMMMMMMNVADAAHCANMYPESPDDLPQLQDARIKIHDLIGKWLSS